MFMLSTLLFLAATAQASLLTLQSPAPKLTEKVHIPLTVGPTDSLKLTFQVVEAESGKGVQPLQTFLRFYDPTSGEEGIQPLRVTAAGKAKFELNMVKPPSSLPPTGTAPLEVTLIVGSPKHAALKIELFDLIVPASHPPTTHPDEASFHPLPVIEHTFRAEQKVPPKPVSALFAALVFSPWVVLFTLWSQISPRVPYLFSPRIFPFTLTLGAFEGLLLWYWIELNLGQVLLYGGILGVLTLFTGKTALATIGDRRVGRK
ncbi:oligosaccharyl transferase delta subunit [Mycena sp. CBHHK59/15]|nr:oligosaccharyl transferase delta subunit [Mycena sp. CBHHK59/15]